MTDDDFLLAVTIAIGGFLLANPLILGGLGLAAIATPPIIALGETIEEADPEKRWDPLSQMKLMLGIYRSWF